jgi:tetratricopeptide (TPR) repeat protein
MKLKRIVLSVFGLVAMSAGIAYADVQNDIVQLQQRWAEINYEIEGKAKLTAFEELVERADQLTDANPDSAAAWTWSGIIKSTFAGAKGGLGALGLAKEAKADLEKAIKIDAQVLEGSALTSLGTLYHSVPGWPVGFGDEDTAKELLERGAALNPEGIDTNYFYGTYLFDQKQYQQAKEHLLRAQQAKPRARREVADAGRQKEITEALAAVERKL